jgi:hypothetical protein
MALSKQDLLGAWTLEEMYTEAADGTKTHPMGRDAGGAIMYTADGHMTAITHCAGRHLPADRPSDEDRAEAFLSYFNYAGTWSLDGDKVTHTIRHALDPNMEGVALTREVDHQGNRMVLSALAPDGETRQFIVWKRTS